MSDAPFHIEGPERAGGWVITCDHASNRVPAEINGGCLGLPPEDMARHIAYDVGAAGVSRGLGAALDSPVICSNFSRLVIDPNRGEDDPTLVMKLYDGSIIPANRHADGQEVGRRRDAYHRPYHDALAELLSPRPDAAICALHSFTPQLNGRPPRPWHIGVLFASDRRLSDPLLDVLRAEPDLCVGANEPYHGALKGDAMDRHALQTGRPHVLIEIRNDLIETPETQAAWAARLAPMLEEARRRANI